ncbi:hypothetical protein [Niallia sp. 03133]
MKEQKKKDKASTVEFGMEFGDMNANKFYDAAASKQAMKNNKQSKNNK